MKVRRALFALGICLASYPVLAITQANVSGFSPNAFSRFNGFAAASQALRQVRADTGANGLQLSIPDPVLGHARNAYRAEPYASDAHFVLAAHRLVRGDDEGADAILAASWSFDRGNQTTGLLRLERAAARSDYQAMARELDYLAVLNPDLVRQLVPALQPALTDPNSISVLRSLLTQKPEWSDAFWSNVPDDNAQLEAFYELRTQMPYQVEDTANSNLLARLVNRGDYERAFALYSRLQGKGDITPPGYLSSEDFAPIGWQLTAKGPVRVRLDQGALDIRVEGGGEGEAARQLLVLGKRDLQIDYEITGDDDALSVKLECTGEKREIASGKDGVLDLPQASTSCRYAWLVIEASAWQSAIQKRARFRARLREQTES
jgi:hypothetical protein